MKSGWAFATTHTPLYFVDFIDISNFFDAAIIKKTAALRRKGLTFSEISGLTGIPKTNIYRLLKGQSDAQDVPKKSLNGSTPYGFTWFHGSLVEVPKEQKVIQIILNHWKSGMGFADIAHLLNRQKHVTKMNKPWTYFAVRSVIRRQLSITNKPKETL